MNSNQQQQNPKVDQSAPQPAAYALDRYTVAPQKNGEQKDDSPYYKSTAPTIQMPKGGGALKGIDEKFNVNAVNGTAALEVPLPLTPGRQGFTPSLSLNYNSGSGNSEFGLGWSLSLPSIQRKTDKQLPQYKDVAESDVFLMAGAEDLVHVTDSSGNILVDNTLSPYKIVRYIPRIEGLFARIEKIKDTGNGDVWWRVTTKDNITTFYGLTANGRIADPDNPTHVFKWLPQLVFDHKGNVQEYVYKEENDENVLSLLHERNRLNDLAAFTNKYLKEVRYCNRYPQFIEDSSNTAMLAPTLDNPEFLMRMVFDYGEHQPGISEPDVPTPTETATWQCRRDPFSDFHAGFELRTYRKCLRVLMFHQFDELNSGNPTVVRSLEFDWRYDDLTDTTLKEANYPVAITQKGWKFLYGSGEYFISSLPSFTLNYEALSWATTIHDVPKADAPNAPQGLTGAFQWIDLWGEGLNGILSEQPQGVAGTGLYYQQNLGEGKFGRAMPVASKPSFTGLNSDMQWADLDADGRRQLVSNNEMYPGYFELDDDQQWLPFRTFEQRVNINWNSPFTKMLDLDGDGRADLLITEDRVWTWYKNKGSKGYDTGGDVSVVLDEEKGPRLLLNDQVQSIFLADMNGDGMTDLVRIKNGEVCYWPNKGYGRFGAKVAMSNAPLFDHPEDFNPIYLVLADISGTGASDIIYLGNNKYTAWINLAGNGFANATDINPMPSSEQYSKVTVMDFLGNGTGCIVWSSPLLQHAHTPMRYIDLMGGKKPYLLKAYSNGFGKTTELIYQSSTQYYLADKQAGTPWATRLPFPVHCVKKVITSDVVSETNYTQEYTYHHGYYDHEEREFRGFGRVETTDTERASIDGTTPDENDPGVLDQYPVLTKTWYHTGAWLREKTLLSAYAAEYYTHIDWPDFPKHITLPSGLNAQEHREAYRALKGMPLRQEVYAQDGTALEHIPYTVTAFSYDTSLKQPLYNNRYSVFHSLQKEKITLSCERDAADPRILHELTLDTDEYGNIQEAAQVAYPRFGDTTGISTVDNEQAKMFITYQANSYTNDTIDARYYRLRMPFETGVWQLHNATPANDLWLPSELQSVFNDGGTTAIDFSATASGLKKRLLSLNRIVYLGDDLSGPLGLGAIDALGIEYQRYTLSFSADTLSAAYGSLVNNSMLSDGGYLREDAVAPFSSAGTNRWWLPSGTVNYPNGSASFYTPEEFFDPWDNKTTITYWSDYWLVPEIVEDAIGNTTLVEDIDWRCLQPIRIVDLNENITEVVYDALCLPVAVALMGKGSEGDSLSGIDPEDSGDINNQDMFWSDPESFAPDLILHATWRCVYDFSTFPTAVAMIARQEHDAAPIGSFWEIPLIRVTYTDGFGRVAMHKIQCENTGSGSWIGSGKTVYNNKGNVVMQYEPFFDADHDFDTAAQAAAQGVSPRMHYDPLGRVYRTDMPDGSYSKTEWTAWMQTSWDQNDTVALPGDAGTVYSQWYIDRHTGGILSGYAEEVDAKTKTLAHADTPTLVHLDTLARPFYTIQDDGINSPIHSYVTLDILGNRKKVNDGRGIDILQYSYNQVKAPCKTISADSDGQYVLSDAGGQPLYSWDADNRQFYMEYDGLRRLIKKWCNDKLLELMEYGEDQGTTDNYRGQLWRVSDGAGQVLYRGFDFKGNPLNIERTYVEDYTMHPDWNGSPSMEADVYSTSMIYDALSRPVAITDPGGGITRHAYDRGGNLYAVSIDNVHGLTDDIVLSISYNARGQRTFVEYGNGTYSTYDYDAYTFRVRNIFTLGGGGEEVQNLFYWYDPVGNVTFQRDEAKQDVYFNNTIAAPENDYTYDALYRLIQAGGREHVGNSVTTSSPDADRWSDASRIQLAHTHDETKMRPYIQYYEYDQVGNMLIQQHTTTSSTYNWTKEFVIDGASNKLLTEKHVYAEDYSYDNRGNLISGMAHLGDLSYNEANRMQVSPNATGSIITYYQYDSGGQRVRKVKADSSSGTIHTRKYVGQWEVYARDQSGLQLERETLHIADDTGRIAIVDTPVVDNLGTGETQLLRYQYANHLGTATLELDDNGYVISYEEYYPFGTTSFQSGRTTAEVSLKRYRFTGKERDEETGMYYHGARYYIPWLCRWSAVDPLESDYTPWSSYNYGFDNPVRWTDPTGMGPDEKDPWISPLAPTSAVPDYGMFLSTPTYTTAKSNLQEVAVADKMPEAFFLVKGNGQGENTTTTVSLKEILEYAGNAKDLIMNAKDGYDVVKNASQNLDHIEKTDDGMRPLETVTMEEMATRPYIKSEGALLKEGVKDVAKSAAQMADVVMTVADVGTKGPAYITPPTALLSEQWHSNLTQGTIGEYGSSLMENVDFRKAEQQGYFSLADYINTTNNQSNIGFVYTTSNIIGREGVTTGSGDSAVSMVDASLATNIPMSAAELAYNEKAANLDVKFAYWGQFVGNKLHIMGQFKIK